MSQHYLYVANWKMRMPFREAMRFATSHYDELVKLTTSNNHKIVLCPSTEILYPLAQMFKETPVQVGAQACSTHSLGAFTGQTSAQSLQEVGCSYCIVGHSEVKKEFLQNDDQIAHICTHLLDYDITPILCIGESEQEHADGQTLKVLERQLAPLIEAITTKTAVHPYLTLYIAYEPIWAIGTGKPARADHVEMVLSWLADHIKQKKLSIPCKLLYGGSISPENIDSLKKTSALDGFLIGTASLDFQNFKKIVQ